MNLFSPARPSASTSRLRPNSCTENRPPGSSTTGTIIFPVMSPYHYDRVDAVELAGVQELAQAPVRSVDVGGEEDLRVLQRRAPVPATSSGSSYQGARRPTMARAFQRVVFGALRRAATSDSMRAATTGAAASSSRPGAASATAARLSVKVVYQPQSAR